MKLSFVKSKTIYISILILITLIIINLTIIHTANILIIEDEKSEIYKEFICNNNEFILSYTHSVLLTPVEEYFIIGENNKLMLRKTIYESFGVGLPYEQQKDEDFEIIGEKFMLTCSEEFSEINMIISPIPNHEIIINGNVYNLFEMINEEIKSIKIYSKQKKILKIWNKTIIL